MAYSFPTSITTDVAIIGAGSAGLNARRAAMAAGADVLLIDPGPFGTTCARVGCMPSKLLIAAAEHAHSAHEAGDFGINLGKIEVDGAQVMTRLRRLRDHFVSKTKTGSTDKIEAAGGLLRARARFVTPTELVTDSGHTVSAKTVIIATGSKNAVPKPYQGLGDRMLTNESIFELETLPDSLLVVGAGAIGLELGQAMSRLGVRTTIVELDDRVAALQDPSVAETARAMFGSELDVHFHHKLGDVVRSDKGVTVSFVGDDGQPREQTYQYVLVAAGRPPALGGMGLQELGLLPLPPVNPQTAQIGDLPIFIAGDVSADRALLHEAAHEGVIAGGNAAQFPNVRPVERKAKLAIVFSEPQIAVCGRSFDELDPDATLIGEQNFAMQSRAKVMGAARGLLRIYADKRTGVLLGAAMIGPAAEHLGHMLAWVIQRGLTVDEALELPFYHPTVEEGVQGALRRLSSLRAKERAQSSSVQA
ncbi:MAG: dihydrolipoyl dehydrogenase [Myxococcales bacterium]|nr:dihydrolipoyl dehydrogenase [Myxococcales bacterium]